VSGLQIKSTLTSEAIIVKNHDSMGYSRWTYLHVTDNETAVATVSKCRSLVILLKDTPPLLFFENVGMFYTAWLHIEWFY
jgi:hypothetical protein